MMEKLNAVMLKQSLPYLYSTDKDLLAQYCKIMKPVATCLDTLQSEVNAYMGILLPTIKLMKDQVAGLRRDNSIVEGQALITYLLENPQNPRVALKGRFEKMFEDKDLLVATALHPHFKLSVVGYLNPALKGDIKRQIVRQMVIRASPGEETGGETGQMQKEDEEDPFKYMRDNDDLLARKGVLEEDIEKAYDEWNRIRVNSKLRVSYDQFPLLHRVAWLDMFLKYNTPLPSSAAVERLFSSGSDILRPKRSNLTADNFEKLVFIKGNLPYFLKINFLYVFFLQLSKIYWKNYHSLFCRNFLMQKFLWLFFLYAGQQFFYIPPWHTALGDKINYKMHLVIYVFDILR